MDPQRDDPAEALELAYRYSLGFLGGIEEMRAATTPVSAGPIALEESGGGAAAALRQLLDRYGSRFSGSARPRYWAFVNGGATPAALAGDWVCSAVDQNGQRNADGPAELIETEALAMLRDLFGLPGDFEGIFVTGGTMANYTALAIALQ